MWKTLLRYMYRPKSVADAEERKKFLSIAYAFLGWNTFAVGFYVMWKNHVPEDRAERIEMLRAQSGSHRKITMKVKGLTVTVNEEEIIEGATDETTDKTTEVSELERV